MKITSRLPFQKTLSALFIFLGLVVFVQRALAQDSGYDPALLDNSFDNLTRFPDEFDPCFNQPCFKPVHSRHDFPRPEFYSNDALRSLSIRTKSGYGFSSDEYSLVAPIGYLRVGFSCKYASDDCALLVGGGIKLSSKIGLSAMERFGAGYQIDTRYSLTLKMTENMNLSVSGKTQVKEFLDIVYLTEGRPLSRVNNVQSELERLMIIYMSTPGSAF